MTLQRGDSVTINSPGDFAGDVEPHGNPRMHGTRAMVLEVTDWGYVLAAPAAATGHYRASAEEVVPAGDSAATPTATTGRTSAPWSRTRPRPRSMPRCTR